MEYEDHRPRVAALRRERMRSRLIEGALMRVARHGVASTSIDDVISEAEVSRGTFYKYFDSPASLVAAVAEEVTNELMLLIDPVVLTHDDAVKRVATGVRLALRLARQYPVVGAFVSRLGWPNLPPDQLVLVFLPRDLQLGMRQGKFARMDLSAALNLTIGAVIGGIYTLLRTSAAQDYPEQAAMTVLMGLGVERQLARKTAYANLKPVPIDGNGLLARTLDDSTSSKSTADVNRLISTRTEHNSTSVQKLPKS